MGAREWGERVRTLPPRQIRARIADGVGVYAGGVDGGNAEKTRRAGSADGRANGIRDGKLVLFVYIIRTTCF